MHLQKLPGLITRTYTQETARLRMASSRMLRRVALLRADVSEELSAPSQRASVASYI
jgi:hypothetical protein